MLDYGYITLNPGFYTGEMNERERIG